MTLTDESKNDGQQGKRSHKKKQTQTQTQNPTASQQENSSTGGIRVDLDSIQIPLGAAMAGGDSAGDPVAGTLTACRYCGKLLKVPAMHEPRCPQNPNNPGRAAEEKIQVFLTADGIGALFGVASDMVAASRGPHWKFNDDEKTALGAAWKQALDVLVPDLGSSKYAVLALALVNSLVVIYPRVLIDAQQQRAAREAGTSFNSRARGDGQDRTIAPAMAAV